MITFAAKKKGQAGPFFVKCWKCGQDLTKKQVLCHLKAHYVEKGDGHREITGEEIIFHCPACGATQAVMPAEDSGKRFFKKMKNLYKSETKKQRKKLKG